MAKSPDVSRAGERGLTLIEALVVVTLTALIALLIFPLASRSASRQFDTAIRALDIPLAMKGEREFRALVGAAAQTSRGAGRAQPPILDGARDRLFFAPALGEATACAEAGLADGIALRIEIVEGDGRLICEGARGRAELLRWKGEQASFSYSSDGAAWFSTWRETPRSAEPARGAAAALTRSAPLVRFEIGGGGGGGLAWVARAGATEPAALPDWTGGAP